MKKTSNVIFSILIIIYLFFINNISFFKSIIFRYNDISFNFLNLNIVISLIFTILFMILFNHKKINKKSFVYFISIIGIYNFIANAFSEFNSFGFLLIYLFLIFSTFCTYLITSKKFEISLVLFCSILVLLFYSFGLFNILPFALIIIIAIIVIGLFIIFKKSKEKSIFHVFENDFLDSGLIIFSILYIIAILGGVGRYIHIWDEYSHWAYDAKVTIDMQKLTLYTGMNYSTSSLPPILTLWHYFVSIFNGYSEPNLYIGLSIFIFIYMMPMFLYINKTKKGLRVLFLLVVYGFNFLFDGAYAYSILYADLAMAFVGTATFVLYFYFKTEKLENKFILSILLFIISLIKSSGFVFSCTILLFIYLVDYLDLKNRKLNIIKFIKKYALCFIFIIVALATWYICVYLSKGVNDYNFSLLPEVLQANISLKINKEFLLKFFTAIVNSFDNGILFGLIQINLLPFLVLVFTGICFVNKNLYKKDSNKYNFAFIFCYVVFFVLTALSLFVMFSVYEAGELKSFGRYLNCFHLMLVNYFLFMLVYLLDKGNKFKTILLTVLLIIIAIIPFSKLSFFVTDYSARYSTEDVSNERRSEFIEIIENTDENSKIYVINQEDTGDIMTMWYARFYCYPRKVNAHNGAINWKILTNSNEWDLKDWGLTFDSLKSHLIEYDFDYIYLYSVTDEFVEGMSSVFDVCVDEIEESKLFKIVKHKNDIELVLIN